MVVRSPEIVGWLQHVDCVLTLPTSKLKYYYFFPLIPICNIGINFIFVDFNDV